MNEADVFIAHSTSGQFCPSGHPKAITREMLTMRKPKDVGLSKAKRKKNWQKNFG
jgi:hypothetical protein